MKLFICYTIFLSLFCFTYGEEREVHTGKEAVCEMIKDGNTLGKLKFEEVIVDGVNAVKLYGELLLKNYTDGEYGFHIHQKGLLTNNCLDAGPHFNPDGLSHGSPLSLVRHKGDLGNVIVTDNKVSIRIVDSRLKLEDSQSSNYGIVGRSLVLHQKKDNYGLGSEQDSKTTGSAGARYACCKIVST